jgi:site-specific DNA recombinase
MPFRGAGGSTDRPALQRLLGDIRTGKIDIIVVYKVDRLTRSLADFAKPVELFDSHGVSFVSPADPECAAVLCPVP